MRDGMLDADFKTYCFRPREPSSQDSLALSYSLVEPGITFPLLRPSPENSAPKQQQRHSLNWLEARRPGQGQS